MLVTKGEYEIDDDPGRIDLDVVQGFLSGSTGPKECRATSSSAPWRTR